MIWGASLLVVLALLEIFFVVFVNSPAVAIILGIIVIVSMTVFIAAAKMKLVLAEEDEHASAESAPFPNLLSISSKEDDLIKKASELYGDALSHTESTLVFLWKLPKGAEEEARMSMLFWTQLNKALWLALLASLRRHTVQVHHMMRFALESGCLACFALHERNMAAYGSINDEIDMLEPDDKVLKKAYDWLEQNYPTHSTTIKIMKDVTNTLYAHANVIPALFNTTINHKANVFERKFFDVRTEKKHVFMHLWWIANVAFGFADLYAQVAQKEPIVALPSEFTEKMTQIAKENERQKKALKPMLSKDVQELLDKSPPII